MKFIPAIRWSVLILLTACLAGCATPPSEQPGYDKFLANSASVMQAKRTYALGYNIPPGTTVTWSELATCLPANWKAVCPAGGILSPGPIGQQMKCTVHGQLSADGR